MTATVSRLLSLLPTILLGSAWLAAVFYHGVHIGYLVFAQASFVLLAAYIFWSSAKPGIKLPRNSLAVATALFWLYLILSIPLGSIPIYNKYTAWLIGMLPAAFFLFQLADIKKQRWNLILALVVAIATGLSLHYTYELISGATFHDNSGSASVFYTRNTLAALLNLVLLTASATFLSLRQQRLHPVIQIMLGASIFMMAYAVGITQSRGALAALFAGQSLLGILIYRRLDKGIWFSLLFILLVALLLANIQTEGGLIGRLLTLSDLGSAGLDRLYIWQASWSIIKESPWLGHGPGMFSLLYPQYRLPEEISGGKYVHNDYLQIWLEMGLLGLLILIALLISTITTFRGTLRRSIDLPTRLEISGLFCGLLSVALHSFFTFNLYILSILVLAGLFLGRLNQLCIKDSNSYIYIRPELYIKPSLIRLLIIIISLIALILLASDWAHQHYYRRAIKEYQQKQFEAADKSFTLAKRLNATNASLVSHASLLIDSIHTWPESAVEKRMALYNEALQLLDKAETINPLRTYQYHVRGHLYSSYPEFTGKDYLRLASNAYRHALYLNPRLYKVRYLLAQLLLAENRENEALEVLEQGLIQTYLPRQNITPYLKLTMALRLSQGNEAGARNLALSIQTRQAEDKRKDIETILNDDSPDKSNELNIAIDPSELTIAK
ncbi:O-antigen ligase family protein [Sulfuriflexus mobilis]|uniref:O-antigen ligase family protein n=1 Tax=Sulfuriflexus mobilis TaxID=1811807 RepID=UPI000F8171DD|nr:O-antigen ligase family protein [Sulfuriflexus mobilis]